jgi:hypothetical protein
MVLIEGEVATGEIVPVRITGALPYDLTGVVVYADSLVQI